MKKSLLLSNVALVVLIISSCLPYDHPTPITDNELLTIIFENRPPPVLSVNEEANPAMTFDEFSTYLVYTRKDIDINSDGRQEILVSGSVPIPAWSFFILYTNNEDNELQELYYADAVGWYVANAQFKVELPYIFVDFLTTYGGTGFYSYGSERNIVRCTESTCDSVSYRYFSGNTSGDYHVSSADVSESQIEIKVSGFYVNTESITETVCDPTGKEFSVTEERHDYFVDTSYYHKYVWEENRFIETDYRETPAFEVQGFFDGTYTGVIPHIINRSVEPNSTMQQTLNAYFDFFEVPTNERGHIPTIPCSQVPEETDWLPYTIPTTVYNFEEQDYFAAVNSLCRLVVWTMPTDVYEPSIKDLKIIGRNYLRDCNPDFISFQWMNITGDNIPELIITSGISEQTIWIFEVSNSIKLLYQADGVARENPMVGVELRKINNDIILKVGIPRSNGHCLDAFICFLLDKDFETLRWNNETQGFVLVQ